ncbi:MAG TPA: hypothetical protein VGK40_13105 [Verrucomicrobiae bacterium]
MKTRSVESRGTPPGQCRPGRSSYTKSRLHESVPGRFAFRALRLGPPRPARPVFDFRSATFDPS